MLIERKLYPECHDEVWTIGFNTDKEKHIKNLKDAEKLINNISENFENFKLDNEQFKLDILQNIKYVKRIEFLSHFKLLYFVRNLIKQTEMKIQPISFNSIDARRKLIIYYLREIGRTDRLFGYLDKSDYPKLKSYNINKDDITMSIMKYKKEFDSICNQYKKLLN